MLWVLKRTISMRRFFWTPKTNVKIDSLENIFNFTLKIFINLNIDGITRDNPTKSKL